MRKIVIISVLVGIIIGVGAFALMFNNIQKTEAQMPPDLMNDKDCSCYCIDWDFGMGNTCLKWHCPGDCGIAGGIN